MIKKEKIVMKTAHVVMIAGMSTAVFLGAATLATAGDISPFLKMGIIMNGDYSEPLGFSDRLVYKGGLDIGLGDLFAIGPELQFQHLGYSGTLSGVDYTTSGNIYAFYGNCRFAPKVKSSISPFVGAGLGLAHGTSRASIEGVDFSSFSGTKGSFHAFGGIEFRSLTADLEVNRIFKSGVDTNAVVNFGVRF